MSPDRDLLTELRRTRTELRRTRKALAARDAAAAAESGGLDKRVRNVGIIVGAVAALLKYLFQ